MTEYSFTSGNENTREFYIHGIQDTQSQSEMSNHREERRNSINLDIISEEPNQPSQFFMESSNYQRPRNNSLYSERKMKMNQISQEVENLYEDSQMVASVKKSNSGNEFNSNNTYKNANFHTIQYGVKSNSSNCLPNSFVNNVMPKKETAQIPHTKILNQTATKKTPARAQQVNPLSSEVNHNDSTMGFRRAMEEKFNHSISKFDEIKEGFCNLVDNYKIKFLRNSEILMNNIIAYTEGIIEEENKNKEIDKRMEMLFDEMNKFLSEYHNYYK
jgi:hypothetical protein